MVQWTLEASQQLGEIQSFIAKDDAIAARAQVVRIVSRAQALLLHPLLGRVVPELGNTAIRELLERPYRIIFTIIEGVPWVLTVWHYRRVLRQYDVQRR
jgi:toxin ParE1/3/4